MGDLKHGKFVKGLSGNHQELSGDVSMVFGMSDDLQDVW